ncbi:MAG: hypothetical protein N4Q32_02065, partial [Neisseriaceae bacterium]|nr:hypothetical protein [Neisseriaceae bacterium]
MTKLKNIFYISILFSALFFVSCERTTEQIQNTSYSNQSIDSDIERWLKLGQDYFYGQGVEQDYTQARSYFLQAAEKKDAKAIYYLAMIYEEGLGVP